MINIQKILLHVNNTKAFILILVFLLVWYFNRIIIGFILGDEYFFYYVIYNYVFIMFVHYFLFKFISNFRNKFGIVFALFFLLISYIISAYALTFPIKLIFDPTDHTERVVRVLEYFSPDSFSDVFSEGVFALMTSHLFFPIFVLSINSIMLRYMDSLKKVAELQIMNANLELDLLKSQVHPHFLFNTLNNLYRLVMDNEQAGQVVLKLSGLLRFSLYETGSESISLAREIQFLEDYIELEKIRHHKHVKITYDFNNIEDGDKQIAPLLFINFVENAFKHGVSRSLDYSWVEIRLQQVGNEVMFSIRNSKPNPGSSAPPVPLTKNENKEAKDILINKNGGLGIENSRKRLEILYNARHLLVISDKEREFEVNLTIIMK